MDLQLSPAVDDSAPKHAHKSAPAKRSGDDRVIETSIPARLDALTWSGFHTRVVLALGITWILDGLEVTLAGALSGALKESPTLQFSNFDVGFSNSAYLAGAVIGALGFGWLTDRIGRKKLFFITLALYLTATAATALSWNVASYALFRFLTGAGIGGEYTAINSTIQELVPARYRGWTDLVINGSFWIGAALGATSAIVLLDPHLLGPDLGWRLAYLTGACLGLIVFVMRMWIPESPRWLMIHGHPEQAHAIVDDIERSVTGHVQDPRQHAWPKIRLRMRDHTPLREVAHTLVLALSPAFAGRAGADDRAGVLLQRDLLHLRAGPDRLLRHRRQPDRLVHPALRGRQFPRAVAARPAVRHARPPRHDCAHLWHVGRAAGAVRLSVLDRAIERRDPDRRMDGRSFSSLLLPQVLPISPSAKPFRWKCGRSQSRCSMRSEPALAAWPVPRLFGALIDTGSRNSVFAGYLLGSALMIAAAVIAWRYAVAAERRSLESVARPLAFVE